MLFIQVFFLISPCLTVSAFANIKPMNIASNTKSCDKQQFFAHHKKNQLQRWIIYMSSDNSDDPQSSNGNNQKSSVSVLEDLEDDEKPADIVGAKFFGGSAEKDEFYDPLAEAEAGTKFQEREAMANYEKYSDPAAFPDEISRQFAIQLQSEINNELENALDMDNLKLYSFQNIKWNSPLSTDKSHNPMKELKKAREFYRSLDIAIVSAKSLSSETNAKTVAEIELGWVISLVWPNAWEARAILSGTSNINFDTEANQILSQEDFLHNGGKNGKDIFGALKSQLTPRFWDLYHVGMSPSAETMQRLPISEGKGFLSQYNLFEIAPRLVYRPSLIDSGGRDMRQAQALPNHAFTTVIKTMGQNKESYVPVSPVEVSIQRGEEKGTNRITWTIPVPPVLAKTTTLLIPSSEELEDESCTCTYEYQSKRKVATLPFGGNPQDSEVSRVRQKLYESVIRDGLRPKKGDDGNPCFFYLQNDGKSCFTQNGLGMAVYEWKPQFIEDNEIGIELEI